MECPHCNYVYPDTVDMRTYKTHVYRCKNGRNKPLTKLGVCDKMIYDVVQQTHRFCGSQGFAEYNGRCHIHKE